LARASELAHWLLFLLILTSFQDNTSRKVVIVHFAAFLRIICLRIC